MSSLLAFSIHKPFLILLNAKFMYPKFPSKKRSKMLCPTFLARQWMGVISKTCIGFLDIEKTNPEEKLFTFKLAIFNGKRISDFKSFHEMFCVTTAAMVLDSCSVIFFFSLKESTFIRIIILWFLSTILNFLILSFQWTIWKF